MVTAVPAMAMPVMIAMMMIAMMVMAIMHNLGIRHTVGSRVEAATERKRRRGCDFRDRQDHCRTGQGHQQEFSHGFSPCFLPHPAQKARVAVNRV